MSVTSKRQFTVTRIAGALGAEIGGIDLSAPLDDSSVAEIRGALLEYLAIFFRDQELSASKFLEFARAFGTPIEYPFVRGIDGYPEIIEITKLEHERNNFGGVWHSDTTYLDEPPMGSMLYAVQVPPFGGDTLFANQYLAYEGLSAPMRGILDGLTAVNSSAKADVTKTREDMMREADGRAAQRELLSEHPAVRTHPETGRRALFVNFAHTTHFKGMTTAESTPILDFLFQHQVKPEYTCRFNWRPQSIAFWDNRAAQHNPVNDYHGFRRSMHRITLAGDRPV
ncbi:MAG: TauD/TfdA family dioxygenase [Steroidobacteraceae bacterium]|nr:TauD/TfdA family dioxygenase [Steroidobacteraceae bacterium]